MCSRAARTPRLEADSSAGSLPPPAPLQFGTKWALQTVHKNITTEDEFDEWLAGVRALAACVVPCLQRARGLAACASLIACVSWLGVGALAARALAPARLRCRAAAHALPAPLTRPPPGCACLPAGGVAGWVWRD